MTKVLDPPFEKNQNANPQQQSRFQAKAINLFEMFSVNNKYIINNKINCTV